MRRGIMIIISLFLVFTLSCVSKNSGVFTGEVEGAIWTFEDESAGTRGWFVASDEFYQHSGVATLGWDDETFGWGMLRLDVDYTNDSNSDWSEIKLKNEFHTPYTLKGVTQFAFDCYLDPEAYTSGEFRVKIYSTQYFRVDEILNMIDATEDAGNGFLKANVEIPVPPIRSERLAELYIGFAGFLMDYKGPIFIDNIRWE
jgi:hypothetical protein